MTTSNLIDLRVCTFQGCVIALAAKNQRYCSYHQGGAERARRYGLSPEQLVAMLEAQRWGCAICKRPLNKEIGPGTDWMIDHDHSCCSKGGSCGKCVRGALCRACNTALGHMGDSVDVLTTTIDYLSRSRPALQPAPQSPPTSVTHLRSAELAERWSTTTGALAQLRYRGIGPKYVRIPGVGIRYSLDSIKEYEAQDIVHPIQTSPSVQR